MDVCAVGAEVDHRNPVVVGEPESHSSAAAACAPGRPADDEVDGVGAGGVVAQDLVDVADHELLGAGAEDIPAGVLPGCDRPVGGAGLEGAVGALRRSGAQQPAGLGHGGSDAAHLFEDRGRSLAGSDAGVAPVAFGFGPPRGVELEEPSVGVRGRSSACLHLAVLSSGRPGLVEELGPGRGSWAAFAGRRSALRCAIALRHRRRAARPDGRGGIRGVLHWGVLH